jgi:hypothetical protein
LGKDGPETEESTKSTLDTLVLDESTWGPPEPESDRRVVRSTSRGNDDTEDDETDNRQDLDRGKPEFTLSVDTCAKHVDDDDNDEAEGDPQTIELDAFGPVVDENGGGGELGGQDDRPVVPVVPAESERQSRVDESAGEGDVSTGNGQVGDHLSEGDLVAIRADPNDCRVATHHDTVADGTHKGVSQEETEGTTVSKRSTGTEEETGSDDCGSQLGDPWPDTTDSPPPIEIIAKCLDLS